MQQIGDEIHMWTNGALANIQHYVADAKDPTNFKQLDVPGRWRGRLQVFELEFSGAFADPKLRASSVGRSLSCASCCQLVTTWLFRDPPRPDADLHVYNIYIYIVTRSY